MSNKSTVLAAHKRYGVPCVVNWPAIGMGATALPAKVENSFIRIKQRQVENSAGGLTVSTTATMPVQPRSLQGARIVVNGRIYNVVDDVEMFASGEAYMVKLVLA